ncbi:MAG: hypothetical protein JEY79_12065 [Pseudodesulfovibrio sp.]|nr:hypothetical protein [Pseudodesulfovibrio sp.]
MGSRKDPWFDDKPFKEGWPKGVRPFLLGDSERLGVGRDQSLYYDGKKVLVSKKITLTWLQSFIAILAAAATIAIAAVEVLTFLGLSQACG